jgi:hypothetical protein
MKLRIVEYRRDPHGRQNKGFKKGASFDITGSSDPIETYDPGLTEGWEYSHAARMPLQIHAQMYFGVESIEMLSPDAEYHDTDLPGQSFELTLHNGKTIEAYNAVIAESHAETAEVVS